MKQLLTASLLLCFLAPTINAQAYEKIADETFKYIKASTFGKPKVAKETRSLAIGQVRVHYKFVTSRMSADKNQASDVTVYLDGEMTKGDLQKLTDEFYTILQQKLAAAGVSFADWKAIAATEYFVERQQSQEDKKPQDYNSKSGQAWVSFSAFDGPVLMGWKPYGRAELVGFGQLKKMAKAGKTAGGDLVTFDVVVDFASIMLSTEITQDKKGWFYGDPYVHSEYSLGGMMSVAQSYIFMVDEKNNFDLYSSELPVAERFAFSDKPYKDAQKASLKTQTFFSGERHTFTPVVIPAKRDLYIIAARRVLALYAEMFATKMRLLRGGEKPAENKTVAQNTSSNKPAAPANPIDARNTPQTTGELLAAATDAKRNGNPTLALQYLDQAIKNDARSTELLFARMAVYEDMKNYDGAIKDAEAVLKMNPQDVQAQYALGTSYIKKQDFKKAAKILGEAFKARPDAANLRANYALSLAGTNKVDDALEILNQGVQMSPREAILYRARALVYKIKGNATAAQADEVAAAKLGQ